VPGRDLCLSLEGLFDGDLVDLSGRRRLAVLVGDLLANDDELLLRRSRGRLAQIELESLGVRIELDEQVAFLDLFVEVEHRADDSTCAGWLDAIDRVVWLDAGLRADLHDRNLGDHRPGDEATDAQHHQDDEQDSRARLISVQGTEGALERVCHLIPPGPLYAYEDSTANQIRATRSLLRLTLRTSRNQSDAYAMCLIGVSRSFSSTTIPSNGCLTAA